MAQKRHVGQGLYVTTLRTGTQVWRFRYRFHGAAQEISFGRVDEVPEARARELLAAARAELAEGRNPSTRRRRPAPARFGEVAEAWAAQQRRGLAPATLRKLEWQLELMRPLALRPLSIIATADLLKVLRPLPPETARRVRARMRQIFDYAIATGEELGSRANPALALRGALPPVRVKHRPAITDPARLGELMRAIDGYEGSVSVTYALRILPRVMTRPGELRGARWAEFDLDGCLWRIPAARMKSRREHLVPLSRDVVRLLRALREVTPPSQPLLFPGPRTPKRPISDMAMNAALRRMGFMGDEHVAHGFRTTASTIMREAGWPSPVIERQLAHVDTNAVRAAYDRSEMLDERRELLDWWSDQLSALRDGYGLIRR